MIISASRRTDIPAFYARWMINRIRDGTCRVPNPFNRDQVSTVSLRPDHVDAIVFWTRSPRPLFPFLRELDARGYRYYFQYTLLDYPRSIDPYVPAAAAAVRTFHELADRIGPERVIWRYDPILIGQATPPDFHRENFARLANELKGSTHRAVISFVDLYSKARRRLAAISAAGVGITWTDADLPPGAALPEWLHSLASDLAQIAASRGMEIYSCAETLKLEQAGIRPGKCVDPNLLARIFGLRLPDLKDPSQRKACGCIESKDIGMYNGCLFGCSYCYATGRLDRARQNYQNHDPHSPELFDQPR